ncbi:hypothetical protein GCM10018785_44340 [Streptomyces longispororuber]|uniref:Uncharacterized protein n=1 Tax=Streptomyces longispororuber TaxID=68230 RepID=A0A919DRN8_9ACTN|nr:hypothetical protein [Streptomyces longispororuber]GHE71137.1 hypothetical protein GCM10018785_44340 [Streptomyces longispororuber]
MQTIGFKSSHRDLSALLAGVAVTAGCAGAAFALLDLASPVRGPLTLFFLVAAPAAACAYWLRGLDPWAHALASVSAGVVVDLLVAQAMLALRVWSVRGGVAAVAVLSAAALLPALARRLRHRAPSRRA